jgi:hypothetical protein
VNNTRLCTHFPLNETDEFQLSLKEFGICRGGGNEILKIEKRQNRINFKMIENYVGSYRSGYVWY